MEKKHKIIIVALIVIILALCAGLAYMVMGTNSLNNSDNVLDGMQVYDFDSLFTMQVPKDAKFIKNWNSTYFDAKGSVYFDRSNEFAVAYYDAPLLNENFLSVALNKIEAQGNITYEKLDDNHVKIHYLKNNGKLAKSYDKSNFTDSILLHKGHLWIIVQGNDYNKVKDMTNTIRLYGE